MSSGYDVPSVSNIALQRFLDSVSGLFSPIQGTGGAMYVTPMAYQSNTLSYLPLSLDASGNLLVSGGGGGGGGTQYVTGVTVASPTGTVALGKNSSNVLGALSLDGSGNLNVNLAAGSISGGNAAASPTGAAPPASAGYTGFLSGSNLVGVSAANPLPITVPGSVAVTGTFFQGTQPVSVAAAVTVQQAVAASLNATVTGSVSVSNFPASQAVTGTFFQSTQPVSIAAAVTTSPPANATTNVTQFGGNNVATGTGVGGVGIPRVTVSSDSFPASQAVTGTFFQGTQPVSLAAAVTVQQSVAASLNATVTGSVSVSNFPASQAVTGTFFQGTQPVSIAASVTTSPPANATTNVTQYGGTNLSTGTGVGGVGIPRVTVSSDSFPASQAVTGTFFQGTQPVSIAAAVTTSPPANATTNVTQFGGTNVSTGTGVGGAGIPRVTVSSDSFPASQAVTGTFFQGTQPVSVAAAVTVAQATAASLNATVVQATAANLNATVAQATAANLNATVVQATAASLNATVTPIALTKGTQGSTGFTVQSLLDAGRNTRIFMLDAFTAAPVAEALQTVVQWYGNAAVAGTTTPAVVPAGKTLRLTGYRIEYQSLATVGAAVVRIRVNTGGVAVLASPLMFSFSAGSGSGSTTVAMTGGMTVETGDFPDGLELPAGSGVGFTLAGYGPTGTLTLEGTTRFAVYGFEY